MTCAAASNRSPPTGPWLIGKAWTTGPTGPKGAVGMARLNLLHGVKKMADQKIHGKLENASVTELVAIRVTSIMEASENNTSVVHSMLRLSV